MTQMEEESLSYLLLCNMKKNLDIWRAFMLDVRDFFNQKNVHMWTTSSI